MSLLVPIPFSIIACYTDIKTRKIKNYITYPLIFIGVFLNTYLYGLEGLKGSIAGVFIASLITSMIPLFRLGGGDLKLAMGYGAFLQSEKVLSFLLYFVLFTVIGNLVIFIYKRGIKEFISELRGEIRCFGTYRAEFSKIVGGPFLLGAYVVTLMIG